MLTNNNIAAFRLSITTTGTAPLESRRYGAIEVQLLSFVFYQHHHHHHQQQQQHYHHHHHLFIYLHSLIVPLPGDLSRSTVQCDLIFEPLNVNILNWFWSDFWYRAFLLTRQFAPWNFNFAPWNFPSLKLSLCFVQRDWLGPLAACNIRTKIYVIFDCTPRFVFQFAQWVTFIAVSSSV